MTKPMYCPMSFNRDAYFANGNKAHTPVVCTPDCAWAVSTKDGEYGCIEALKYAPITYTKVNTRPLEGDAS